MKKEGRQALRKEIGRALIRRLKNLMPAMELLYLSEICWKKKCGRIHPRSGKERRAIFENGHARISDFLHFLPETLSLQQRISLLVECKGNMAPIVPFFVCLGPLLGNYMSSN